jgi:hypothetical protein
MSRPGPVITAEAISREADPDSGSRLWQLTSAPAIHSNIYCEVPYTDPTSRYVFYQKSVASQGPWELWRVDLETHQMQLVCEDTAWTLGVGISFDQRFFYCMREVGPQGLEIIRVDTTTLDIETAAFEGVPGELSSMAAISPDLRMYYASSRLGDPAEHRFGVLQFDLKTGERQVIHERGDDLCNAHVQMDPCPPHDLLIQHNRGALYDDAGNLLKLVDEPWATLYLIDTDGGNFRQLPVGKPWTQPCQGHQCFIGTTGEVLLTVVWDSFEQASRDGCLLKVRPGDDRARVVARGHTFMHPNASRDGRFFVTDTWAGKRIVVGSIRTGRCQVLCESGASIGGPQYTHPHPYFTPDRRWVIFNSDTTGVPHIYAASVPAGLLEELEE